MNTSALKNFAPAVRRQLIEAVTRKLDYVLTARTPDLLTVYALQVASLSKLAQTDRNGLVERVAYTWFNRFAALRFMDAHGWHPFRARIITPVNPDETQPEILRSVLAGSLPPELAPFSDPKRINSLLDGTTPSPDPQGEVYRHLVLAACRFYNALLPNLFERLDDETELLLPDDLLTEQSVVQGFRTEISDADCSEVEILGWLYQFYISERKDQVMARKSAVPTEDIPAVTQLFTPHWIVRYLVENSLGRLWLNSRPSSRLREHMPYYIEDAIPEPVAWQQEWHDSISFREGDYTSAMWLRPNPAYKDKYCDSLWYALTIDGYAYAKRVWGVDSPESGGASDKMDSLYRDGQFHGSFEDLRALLFLWQRDCKWSDSQESEEMYNKCYAAVCEAWDREWRNNQAKLPDLSRLGIRLPDSSCNPQPSSLTVGSPEEIKLCDPACGSGHMLTYAFDLLYRIYEEEGYAPNEIPGLILKHNLYGVEICPRAAQLSELALVFKAREKFRRFFQPGHFVRPNIMELRDVRFEDGELTDYFKAIGINSSTFIPHTLAFPELLHQFEETKNFGSLIQPCVDEQAVLTARRIIEAKDGGGQLFLNETHLKVLRVLEQAEALTQRYHVVVANPPYMGSKSMDAKLKKLSKDNYPETKSDLYAMFLERGLTLAMPKGYLGMITMQSWMFLTSYQDLRKTIISKKYFISMAHLGARAFDSIGGEVVQSTAFVLANDANNIQATPFIRLVDGKSEAEKSAQFLEAISNNSCGWFFKSFAKDFRTIPGSPIAYWLSKSTLATFTNGKRLGDIGAVKTGMSTTDNERFVRLWFEVSIGMSTLCDGVKWVPYNKGGGFRKWYGNLTCFVNWADDGREIKEWVVNNPSDPDTTHWSRRIFNTEYFFKSCSTWGDIGTGAISVRHLDCKAISDSVGIGFYANDETSRYVVFQLLNSKVASVFTDILCPTMHFNPGAIAELPVLKNGVTNLSEVFISIAQADWDNFETSWDFQDLPLLRPGLKGATLEASWRNWEAQSTAAIRRMQELEKENNRLFIEAYGLQDELKPDVPEDQITLARADVRKDMAAFLSYTIGCIMGRYSLDKPGLILADAGDTFQAYLSKVGKAAAEIAFSPDEDGIIPVLDGEWFEDDVVSRTRDFLRATYGENTLRENLRFIEESLGKDIRKYFLNDFYKDHLQTYKKRPIYWLVQSPKKGFSVLIYQHRYTRDTLNIVLNRYLRPYQDKLRGRISHLEQAQADPGASARDKTAARKEAEKLVKTLHECEEWERDTLLPLAQQRIELDLDDGVKVNYLKLGETLAPIPGLATKEED
jgi:hypothetical protein